MFVAQQRGQCGGVGELLYRRSEVADGEVVVIVVGEFVFGQAAGQVSLLRAPFRVAICSACSRAASRPAVKESTAASATVPTRVRVPRSGGPGN